MRGKRFKTQADIDRYIKQGYGQGEGAKYLPWLSVQDVPSRGRSRKLQGTKIDRVHHLLSDLEYVYFLLLEFSERVVDIREQYPLFPTADAQRIAAEFGIRYPKFKSTQLLFVMTSDFLVTWRDQNDQLKLAVRTLKYDADLADPSECQRTVEKFELERAIWTDRGVDDWKIVTHQSIDAVTAKNLQWLRKGAKDSVDGQLLRYDVQQKFMDALEYFMQQDRTMSSVIRSAAHAIRCPYPEAVTLFKHQVWNKSILFDIAGEELQLTGRCPELRFDDLGQSSDNLKAA